MIHTCYEFLRKRRQVVPLENFAQLPQEGENWAESLTLWQAIGKLSEELRAVVVLFYYEDLPVREISKILGVSESAVKTRLSRARQRMRKFLLEGDDGNE